MANEDIQISNAGLVLLTVYFPQLFSALGLTRNNVFVDQDARYSAVNGLAYLATPHIVPAEPMLVLNKLLCGMPIHEEVPSVTPSDSSKIILDSLLSAVLANWPKLRNNSADALREVFLQRAGRLVEDEAGGGEHWRLNVQQATVDVLLMDIPWNFRSVKLPWMKEAIQVDWP
jgi:hypothetical protein